MSNLEDAVKVKVIIVGAGISGLTAAYYLDKNGYDVLVLEAQKTPGGRMRQIDIEGVRVNTGARVLYTFYTTVMELIKDLKLENEIEYVGMSEMMCEDGQRRYPVSFTPGPGLLFNSVLKLRTRLRLANLLPDLLKAKFVTDANDMCTSEYADGQNMEDYFSRKVGSDFVEKIVNPLFRGARSWNSADISPAFFLTTTAHMIGHKAFTFRQGIGYLCQVIASRLNIKYGVGVYNIERNPNNSGVEVNYTKDGVNTKLEADIVVCATEGAKIDSLVTNKNAEEEEFMTRIQYNSLGIVYHVLKQSPEHAITFYTEDHPSPLAILEAVPGKNGKPHLFCELAPEAVRDVAREQSQDKMDELIIDDTRKRFTSLDKHLDYSVNQWIEHMLPIFYPGYITPLKNFIRHQNSGQLSIYYCGDYLSQALVGGASASGKRVAENIMRDWISTV